MKKIGIVLRYELKEYLESKGFVAFTIVLALVGAALLFLPRFIDMSDFTGVQVIGGKQQGDGQGGSGEAGQTGEKEL